MDKITDRFEFDHVMAIVREHARTLPHTQDELTHLLGLLIEDALAELAGEKFASPRSMGDLSSADGITHLFADYPAAIPLGGKRPRPFLTVEEAAAARYLATLYRVRESLNDGFGLPEDDLAEIKAAGLDLLDWRRQGAVLEHDKEKRAEKRGASKGGATKAEREAQKLDARNKKITNRASQLVGLYNKTEALDILQREFSKRFGIGRTRISQIVSSIFPTRKPRAKSSE